MLIPTRFPVAIAAGFRRNAGPTRAWPHPRATQPVETQLPYRCALTAFPRATADMLCPRCQQDNPPQARFCMKCGASVMLACGKCGTELPTGAAFCISCGQPVGTIPAREPRFTGPEAYTPRHLAEKIITSKAALEGERKQVTILFADLK